jgi:hypothetical protein
MYGQKDDRMDMHWLDDVLVLLEEGNMTRAAMRRNVTQPAFSRLGGTHCRFAGQDCAF